MRIGELADLIGISTRAIRHYHRIGLLGEPARRANGYREYSLRDAVELGFAATGRTVEYVSHEFYRIAGLIAEEWICTAPRLEASWRWLRGGARWPGR